VQRNEVFRIHAIGSDSESFAAGQIEMPSSVSDTQVTASADAHTRRSMPAHLSKKTAVDPRFGQRDPTFGARPSLATVKDHMHRVVRR